MGCILILKPANMKTTIHVKSVSRTETEFSFYQNRDRFRDVFPDFCELAQEDYTRRGTRDGAPSSLSRIDRVYCNLPAAVLNDLHPTGSTTTKVTNRRLLSDHVPVSISLAPSAAQPPQPSIPLWVAQHPLSPSQGAGKAPISPPHRGECI